MEQVIKNFTSNFDFLDLSFSPEEFFNTYFSLNVLSFVYSTRTLKIKDNEFELLKNELFKNDEIIIKESIYPNYSGYTTYEKFYINLDSRFILALKATKIEEDKKSFFSELKLEDFETSFMVFGAEQNKQRLIDFLEKLIKVNKEKEKENKKINIICNDGSNFYTKSFSLITDDIDIDLNYNDDFKPIFEKTILSLKTKTKGLVLLYGKPGTGKTHILRSLPKYIDNKEIIFVPPDIAGELSNPMFISFFITRPNSIFLIEDAENILKSRKALANQAVSNLLNLTDGLLSDALKIQVACTFNTDINNIDSALRRPGRLIVEYDFKDLNKDKAQTLINKLYPEDNITIDKDMSLAEIYNYKEQNFSNISSNEVIGFKTQKK